MSKVGGVLSRVWALDDGGTKSDLEAIRVLIRELDVDQLFKVRDALIDSQSRVSKPIVRWVDEHISKFNKYC